MAADPIDNAGFSIPSLQQYQQLLRQQAADVIPNTPGSGWARLAQTSMFDLVRSRGYLSPQEQLVAKANVVQQGAVQAAAAETDPAKNRLAQLTYMMTKFNQLGLSDLSAKIMPEYNALSQRQLELRKLGADATTAETAATVAQNTEGANIVAPFLKNEETQTNIDFTRGPKTEGEQASAAAARANAAEKAGEYQNYVNPKTGAMTAVLKTSAAARAALVNSGFVEDNINLAPQKPGDLAPTKQTETNLQKSIIDADNQLDQLRTLAGQFKPDYLTLGGKVSNWALGLKDQTVGLTPEQAAGFNGFTQFRAGSIDAFNNYIHAITGAQMSQGEAVRIQSAFIDAKNDGPQAYVSKLRETARKLVQVRERARRYLDAGGDPATAPTGDQWDRIPLRAVTDAQVDQFLGRNFGIPSAAPPRSAAGTSNVRSQADAILAGGQ